MGSGRSRRWALVAACAATVVVMPFGAAVAATRSPNPVATSHVIVLLKNQHTDLPADPASSAARVRATAADQAPLVRDITAHGGRANHALHVVNAVSATVDATEQARLASDPSVASVVPDRVVAAPRPAENSVAGSAKTGGKGPASTCPADPSKPQLEPEALEQTSTAFPNPARASAQQFATGKGVRVAFLADGLDVNNPDFVRADGSHVFVDYKDFSGDGPNAPTDAREAFGDASSIAAQGRISYDLSTFMNPAHPLPAGCNIRILGMAPGAELVGLKVFPAGGFAFNSAILAALDYAVTVDHVDVVNESFGSNQYPDTNDDPTAVFNAQLVQAGIPVIASTGDAGGQNTIGSPASTQGVIGVGATTSYRSYAQTGYYGFPLSNGTYASNNISALSSSGITQPGGTLDLVAPGDLNWALCSTNTDIYAGCTDNNGNPSPIQLFGGSSESAPLTAGAAALVIQAYRNSHHGRTPPATLVERILTSSADDLGLPAIEQGAGQLNSLRAVKLARSTTGSTAAATPGLLTGSTQLDLTATAGHAATGSVKVQNTGTATATITPRLRADAVLRDSRSTVVLSRATDPVTISQLGALRSYRKTTFTVPAGASRVSAEIAWPDPAQIVRLVLLDPTGRLEAYSLPQGFANFGYVDVRKPKAGVWTAILMTNATTGYAGPVQLETTSYRTTYVGSVSPSRLRLAPGATGTVTITVPAGAAAADNGYALVTASSGPVVPVVVRTLISTGRGAARSMESSAAAMAEVGFPHRHAPMPSTFRPASAISTWT